MKRMIFNSLQHICVKMCEFLKRKLETYIFAPININASVYIPTREGLLKIQSHAKDRK